MNIYSVSYTHLDVYKRQKLNTEVANLTEMATVGKNHIASLRETAVETYRKLMGDKVDEKMCIRDRVNTDLSTIC